MSSQKQCPGCHKFRPSWAYRKSFSHCIYCEREDAMRPKGTVAERQDRAKIGRTSVASPLSLTDEVECEACGVKVELKRVEAHLKKHRGKVERTWFRVNCKVEYE